MENLEELITAYESRKIELIELHTKQVNERKNNSIATRSNTLGKLRELKRVIADLKGLRIYNN